MNEREIVNSMERFESRSDEDLLKIWRENNILEYSTVSFEAIRRILSSRDIDIPKQIPFDQERLQKALKVPSYTPSLPSVSSKHFPFYMIGVCLFATWIIFSPAIKDFLIHSPTAVGYTSREELMQAGNKRVLMDFVVFCISAVFGLISLIQLLLSRE